MKNCFCFTCDKEFHSLGIARHRAMHKDKKENCKIAFADGKVVSYTFEDKKKLEVEEWKSI